VEEERKIEGRKDGDEDMQYERREKREIKRKDNEHTGLKRRKYRE
jgi:hypothetical protein